MFIVELYFKFSNVIVKILVYYYYSKTHPQFFNCLILRLGFDPPILAALEPPCIGITSIGGLGLPDLLELF